MSLLLIPMALCLWAGFMVWGIWFSKRWSTPRVFYPKTMIVLKEKLIQGTTSRYVYDRYTVWCHITGSQMSPEDYLVVSLIGAVLGFITGIWLGNPMVSICLFALFLLLPTLLLYARFTVKLNAMIKSFGRFVDLFSRHYSSRKNIVLAFRDMVNECPRELQAELLLLNNRLADGGRKELAVEQFADRLNHGWAHDFATYVISGLEGETRDIQSSLNRLTSEMFLMLDEREERQSEIHSIWISLLIVIIICLLFIPYNQTLLKDSFRLYFFTPDGQALITIALTLWCFCVLLAFIWGKRHE